MTGGLRSQIDKSNIAEFGPGDAKKALKIADSQQTDKITQQSKNIIVDDKSISISDVKNAGLQNKQERVIIKKKNSELSNGLPLNAAPNSVIDKTDESGNTLQRREYGADRRPARDYDTTDHNRPDIHKTGAHKHTWAEKNGKWKRGEPEKLTDEELERNKDIIRKGENYNDES